MRTVPAALLLLVLSGCAARPPMPAEEPPPRSPLARAALSEWDAWGRVTTDGWTYDRPADTAATDQRFARLVGYWQAVPGGRSIAWRHQTLRAALRGTTAEPTEDGAGLRYVAAPVTTVEDIEFYASPAWSAAFISAIARQAGIPNHDLPSASRHARYIDAVLLRWRSDPAGAAFQPHAPEDYAPAVGDLVCGDRSYAPLAHWTQRYAQVNRPRPMHCDVVVRTAPGVVEMIGGNVRDMVTRRRMPAYADGRLVPAPPDFPPFVVILAAREPAVTPILPVAPAAPEAEAELGE